MKTIKPQKLGVLTRTFEADRRQYLVVSSLVCVPLGDARAIVSEVDMWKSVGPELAGGALDEGFSKPRGEVLVTGRCMAPGGVARPVSYVRVKLGAIDKRLAVIGDRVWKDGVPTPPTPFVAMPVDLAHAFGGPEHPDNPTGKGSAPVADVHPLPNVELPDRLITSPKHRPPPASLGPLPLEWPARRAKAGTYDEAWLATRAPGIPKDADLGFFNAAPADQQLPGYLRGDEAFVIEHMNAARPWIEGKLPGVVARSFITQRKADGEAFREVAMRLDTVRFFPNVDRGVLVYRGMIEIAEDDAADVLHLVAACEDPGSPKPTQHYVDVLALRLDRRRGALAGLRDSDLMPAGIAPAGPGANSDLAQMLTGEDLLRKNMRRRREAQIAEVTAKLEAQGVRPADVGVGPLPPDETVPDLEDPDALVAMIEKQQAIADEQIKAAEAKREKDKEEIRRLCAKEGVDFDAIVAAADVGGPPRSSAAQQIAALPPAVVAAQPQLPEKLRDADARALAAYRVTAHLQRPPRVLDAAARARLGADLAAAVAKGEGVAERDFTCANLAGQDLRGANLAGALLEGADLTGADLAGANLAGAVLARATLHKARFTTANLARANLGQVRAGGVDFSGADLSGAILMKADLVQAKLTGAKLDNVDLMEAQLAKADLGGVVASELRALQANLAGAKFVGAKLARCAFVEVDLAGADFTGATLTRVAFVTCRGDGALFRRASLEATAFVHDSSFPDVDFREARLAATNLRGTVLTRAMFDAAKLDGVDLSECDLSNATLLRVLAPSAMLVRADLTGAKLAGANLMGAILQKAILVGADLSGCNLFRADLARVKVDGKTKLDRALLKQARVNPRSPDGAS